MTMTMTMTMMMMMMMMMMLLFNNDNDLYCSYFSKQYYAANAPHNNYSCPFVDNLLN